jgi:hypothetical protein
MFWEQFKVLLPSMIGHLILTVALFSAAWWVLKRFWPEFHWPIHSAIIAGTSLSLFFSVNTMTQLRQGAAMGAAAEKARAQAAQQSQMTEGQIRQEFVKVINQLISNPGQVNDEVKRQFQAAFGPVLSNQELKNLYVGSVANIFTCQKLFYSDALESMKRKKEVKTPDRVTCETLAGEFFGRPTLIPQETVQANKKLIKDLSESRKPASKDQPLPTEQELKNMIQQQDVALQVLQFLLS